MADPDTRRAARLATLIAVPLAVLAGVGAYLLLSGVLEREPAPSPTTTHAPVATGPVQTEARPLGERAELVCRALLAQLPQEVGGLVQRPVTEGPEQNAAYGDPPVRLACGVPPADFPPTAHLLVLSGVCWYPEDRGDESIWITVDREVPVRVTVPAAYQGPSQQVIGFSPAITGAVRSAEDIPSGCRP